MALTEFSGGLRHQAIGQKRQVPNRSLLIETVIKKEGL